jgi:ferritin-like metal-binding protein YciE
MPYTSLRDVAGDKIAELLDSGERYRRVLPKLSGATHVESLRALFDERLGSIERLCTVLQEMCAELEAPLGVHSSIMREMIEEAKRVCALEGSHAARDAALVGIAQRIEHDLFSSARQLQRYAKELTLKGYDRKLGQAMHEAEAADRDLDAVAHGTLFGRGVDRAAAEEVDR